MILVNRYILKEDQVSTLRDKKGKTRVYGKKGDPVTMISKSEPVMIVEGKNKDRFPVLIANLIPI